MMLNLELPARLAARLDRPLPGWQAQSRFQPELGFSRHRGPAPRRARPAAVLVLLYPRRDSWHLPLILRSAHMLDHASQVSLPGGVIEPGESSRQAALREFREELGAPAEQVEILGRLSELYLFASDFRVVPWVGTVGAAPDWTPSPREVERVLEVPLAHLVDPAATCSHNRRQGGIEFAVPCFTWEGEHIWGATSMVLAELVAVLQDLEE